MASMNAPMPELILHDGKRVQRTGALVSQHAGRDERDAALRAGLDSRGRLSPLRPRLGDVRIAVSAPACAWDHACALEADGFVPADRRAHTFPGPGKRRLAIRDRRRGPCLK